MLNKCCYCGGKGRLVPRVIEGGTLGKYTPYFAECTKCKARTALLSNASIASEEWNNGAVIIINQRVAFPLHYQKGDF